MCAKASSPKLQRNAAGIVYFYTLAQQLGPSFCFKKCGEIHFLCFWPPCGPRKQHGFNPQLACVTLFEIVRVGQGLLPKIQTKFVGENQFLHTCGVNGPQLMSQNCDETHCFYALATIVGMRDIVQLRTRVPKFLPQQF